MNCHGRFDIVTAARVLQWIADPAVALAWMKAAAKPNGMLLVLNFNHAKHKWEPQPPPEFSRFFQAFLDWRRANQWDNEKADHLPALFQSAGLVHVESHVQDEIVERGDHEFAERAALWSDAIANIGGPIVKAGLLTEMQWKDARECYAEWIRKGLEKQSLQIRTITWTLP